MQFTDQIGEREAQIVKISQSKRDIAALRQHLKRIIEDPAFKSSQRSTQFLKFIVERSLAGKFDSLKERLIGIDLFGRDVSYETGEDAIVRVTASDVRKRLLQFYGRNGTSYEFRLSLPLGSYIPEITRRSKDEVLPDVDHADAQSPSMSETFALDEDRSFTNHTGVVDSPSFSLPRKKSLAAKNWIRWFALCTLLLALNISLWATFRERSAPPKAVAAVHPVSILPWSAIFSPQHSTQVITSDANIAQIQKFIGAPISASDYISHNYIFRSNMSPQAQRRLRNLVRTGGFAPQVDVRIVASIAALAQVSSKKIEVQGARDIQLTDVETDDNFIFLGSPHTDPWSTLFNNQLDFQIVPDKVTGREFIRNVHPRPNEQSEYIPTALGWATGQSYSILAFVQNPDQGGQVLLLAGANAEGTGAAAKLATDLPLLSATLQKCGISPTGPLRHFELLLRVNTMAGSPTSANVIACHILPDIPAKKS